MTYPELVQKRKKYRPDIPGLINPSEFENGDLDAGCYLEPWAKWHDSVPAKIFIVGQDWGGTAYYKANNGKDNGQSPTCKNLKALFEVLNIDIGEPHNSTSVTGIHFTNIIPFLRTGKMQGELNKILNQSLINQFASEFTKPLISVVKPKVIVTLGMSALIGVTWLYNYNFGKNVRLRDLLMQGPFELAGGIKLFPMFHCGSNGVNRNRKLDQQKDDWKRILPYIL
jgi:hypothetical protein